MENNFGEVKVVKRQITMNKETSLSREPQVPLQEQSNIKKITMNIEKKIEISTGKAIRDVMCLIDGRVIIVEQHGDVYLLTSDGKLQTQLPISGGAFTIAITYPGKQIWQYKQDFEGPNGLCKDTYGNIIVADWKSHKFIVISHDGQDSKVMLREEDGLKRYPKCICLNNNEPSGFICDSSDSYIAKFNLSFE
ncbi:unnamed protein product [Mytilus coruscus]|uniref:TRIM2_3 n=1 Tax=Mytilus coruscus TaxID=42192 RepID=A0A6J8D8Z7_MYTCO|nr:unnamed protein product [Mytilus coruscus]